MRRTLKLLLVMGLAFVLQRPHGGGDGPDGPDDTTHNGPDGEGNDSKKTTTPDGINASEDWGAAKDATKEKAEAGRAKDTDGDGQPDITDSSGKDENPESPSETEGQFTQEQLDQTFDSANTPAKLEHVIDPPKHGFDDLVEATGGRSEAMRAIVDSINDVADLPERGRFEVERVINGEVVTIRGAVVNGIPRLGTAFISSKFPGGS